MPPENSAPPKLTSPPENSAPPKLTVPPENLAPSKSTVPPENSAPLKLTSPPENLASPKLTSPPENLAPPKSTVPLAKLAPSEPDNPAGELGAAEVAAVEDHAGEVEVEALPGHRRARAQMVADEPDDGVAYLPVGPVSGPYVRGGVVAGVGVIGQAQVGAQNIDAGLPVLLPVISQPGHGVHPGQAHRRLAVAELGGDRREPLIQQPRPVMRRRSLPAFLVQCHAFFVQHRGGLGDPLPPVGHDQGDQRARPGDRGEHQLRHPDRVMHRDHMRARQRRMVQQHQRHRPQRGQPGHRNNEAGRQRIADPPQPRRTGLMQARQPRRDLSHTVTVRLMGRADQPSPG